MLRPIELDAAGDPGSQQSHEGGLDDILAVDQVIARMAVLDDMDAAADLRQDHHAQVLVLEVDGLPAGRRAHVGDAVGDRFGYTRPDEPW